MGDPLDDSFIQLINQNLGIAHKVARLYFTEMDDRDDVMQEMMYQLWRSYKGFDGRSKFSTWMYRVCLNTALTHRRKDKKHTIESLSLTHHQIANQPVENKNESIELLFEVIAKLPSVNKTIVLLHLEKVSYEEIAAITGLSKSNVSVRLVRIKREIETEMRKKIKSKEDVNF